MATAKQSYTKTTTVRNSGRSNQFDPRIQANMAKAQANRKKAR